MVVDDIKRTVSMRAVAERYGLQISRGMYISCPFHVERTPSLKVYSESGKGFYCYGCNAGGSVIDFVMMLENIDFTTAIARLAYQFGLSPTETPDMRVQRTKVQMAYKRLDDNYKRLEREYRRITDDIYSHKPLSDEWCKAQARLPHLIDEMEYAENALSAHGRR